MGLCCERAHSGTHRWACLWGWHPLTSQSRILGERRRNERLSLADDVGVVPIGCSQQSLGCEGLASTATIIPTPVPQTSWEPVSSLKIEQSNLIPSECSFCKHGIFTPVYPLSVQQLLLFRRLSTHLMALHSLNHSFTHLNHFCSPGIKS